MNLPNRITITRIILVPIFMLFIVPLSMNYDTQIAGINIYSLIAAIIFVVASITDGLDGHIARSRNLITNFGKFLDPIADKLLISGALLTLVERGDVSSWVAMIIITREFIVTALRLVAASEGIVIAASKSGKIKTVTQIVAVTALITQNWPLTLIWSGFSCFSVIALTLAVITTVYSGIEYVIKNKQVFTEF